MLRLWRRNAEFYARTNSHRDTWKPCGAYPWRTRHCWVPCWRNMGTAVFARRDVGSLYNHLFHIWYTHFWDLYIIGVIKTFRKNTLYEMQWIITPLGAVEGLLLVILKSFLETFKVTKTYLLLFICLNDYLLWWNKAKKIIKQLHHVKNVWIKFETVGK